MKYKYTGNLYCFSPPAMLATFIIELILAVYTLIRYKSSLVRNLSVGLLICLAIFQLAEYNTCGRFGIQAAAWSSIGFVAITLLPPLAVHLIQAMSKRGLKLIHWLAYASSVPWLIFFVQPSTFSGHVCAGNYAIFQLADHFGGWYFAYYYLWLFVGLGMALFFAFSAKKKMQEALILQTVGYLVFLLPTALTNTVKPSTIAGLPSIMCGFAVLYALILVFGILPRHVDRA
jgi:hypothetical protein